VPYVDEDRNARAEAWIGNRKRPPLSIVIPSHNRPDLLRPCLASVARHAPLTTEIIVVDDASPDGAVSSVAREFTGVRIVRLPRRGGFCVAVNAGIRAATATIIELLNDDTEVTAGSAAAALRHFEDEEIAAVAPLVLCHNPYPDWSPRSARRGTRLAERGGHAQPALIDSAGDRYFLGGVAAKRGHRQPLTAEYLQRRWVFGASGSSAFYRRKALVQVGGFPESFGAYFEDVDVAFRLQRAGYRAVYEPESRVWHRVSASYGKPRRRLLEQQSRNEERVFWRNVPSQELWRALPLHLAVLAGKALRRWHDGTLAPFVSGRFQLLREVSDLLRHRRQLATGTPTETLEHWSVERRYWAARA
jgi:GT2 family glycosyltransferase